MSSQLHVVFVYGTLKKNEPNHHYLSTATFKYQANAVDKFPLVIASKYNIPFLLDKPGEGLVSKFNINNYIYVYLSLLYQQFSLQCTCRI